jgi:hypothetical protein
LRSLINVNTPADLIEARESAEGEPRYVRGGVKLEVVEVSSRRSTRSMPSEMPVTIHLNEREIATTQATPRDLEDLAAGFLLSEGLLSDRELLGDIDVDAKRGLVWVSSAEASRGRSTEANAAAFRVVRSACRLSMHTSLRDPGRDTPAGPAHESRRLSWLDESERLSVNSCASMGITTRLYRTDRMHPSNGERNRPWKPSDGSSDGPPSPNVPRRPGARGRVPA